MALELSGTMSLAGTTLGRSIALELGLNTTSTISLNDASVRGLAGIASGTISISDFFGKGLEEGGSAFSAFDAFDAFDAFQSF